jgi:hypothetical protein
MACDFIGYDIEVTYMFVLVRVRVRVRVRVCRWSPSPMVALWQ